VYNRGVEKRAIFLDDQDYRAFLHFLEIYLSPLKPLSSPILTRSDLVRPRPVRPIDREVELLAYCLMPNHFHLLVRQVTKDGMTKLIRRIATIYAMYFNERNHRVGTLFQGKYKAVLLDSREQLLHLSRYIHLNPAELTGSDPFNYDYSSYDYYLGRKHAEWINPKPVLSYFHSAGRGQGRIKEASSYQDFVASYLEEPEEGLGSLVLE
jgi:putative transposase